MGIMAYDPAAFGQGLVMGTSSLVRRTLASLLTSMCHLSVSMQIALSALGVVDPFLGMSVDGSSILLAPGTYRGLSRSAGSGSAHATGRPLGAVEGLMLALQGLLSSPYVGATTGGLKGLVVGIAHAFLGLGAKPLYGLLADASRRMDSLSFRLLPRVLGEHKYRLRRARPPRFFAPGTSSQPLSVYSEDENIGSELLSRVARGQYRAEGYVWYAQLHGACIVIITSARVIVVGESDGFCELLWQCPLRRLLFLEIDVSDEAAASGVGESPPSTPSLAMVAAAAPNLRVLEDCPTTPGPASPASSASLATRLHRSLKSQGGEDEEEAAGVRQRGEALGRGRSNSAPAPLSAPHTPQRPAGPPALPLPLPSPQSPQSPSRSPLLLQARRAPVLHLYYLPTENGRRPAGLALKQWSLHLLTQEALLVFLVRLVCLLPGLAGTEVLNYLRACGVTGVSGSEAREGGQGRSPGPSRGAMKPQRLLLALPKSPPH